MRGCGMVGKAEFFAIPVEPLSGKAVSDGANEHGFGQRATVAEVGAGLLPGEDRVHPVVVVVLRFDAARVLSGREIGFGDHNWKAIAVVLEDVAGLSNPTTARFA